MWTWNPQNYPQAVQQLLEQMPPNELGPGQPQRAVYQQLKGLDHRSLFGDRPVTEASMADACLAGLWLAFDFLDESHTISQAISSSTGSYWHGIMHRREPDYENAKYWFRRVGRHPIESELARQATQITHTLSTGDTDLPAIGGTWNAIAFVDQCRQANRAGGTLAAWCRQVALAEWRLLFDYSFLHS